MSRTVGYKTSAENGLEITVFEVSRSVETVTLDEEEVPDEAGNQTKCSCSDTVHLLLRSSQQPVCLLDFGAVDSMHLIGWYRLMSRYATVDCRLSWLLQHLSNSSTWSPQNWKSSDP